MSRDKPVGFKDLAISQTYSEELALRCIACEVQVQVWAPGSVISVRDVIGAASEHISTVHASVPR